MVDRLAIPCAALFALAGCTGQATAQANRPKIEGRVVDADGEPLAGARVSIATAGVRRGVSPY